MRISDWSSDVCSSDLWHATDELTLGAMVSKGYNGGGAGFTFDVPFRNFVFEEEEVWTYEAYGRADLDGGRLALTGTVFFSDYKNRSEERRVGKECVRTCRSRWSQYP